MTYILDANIAIGALNRIKTVEQKLAVVPASEVGVPIVALAETLFRRAQVRETGRESCEASRLGSVVDGPARH